MSVVIAVAAALPGAGCGSSTTTGAVPLAPSSTSAAAATVAGVSTAASPAPSASAAPSTTPAPSASAAPSTNPAPSTTGLSTTAVGSAASTVAAASDFANLPQCIATRWKLLADQAGSVFRASPLASLPGFSYNVAGEGFVTFDAAGTYRYTPAFTATIGVQGQTGTGSWSGELTGTWKVVGNVLTMAQTNNAITGTITVMGISRALPTTSSFNGTGTVITCTPQTFSYEVPAPTGAFTQTLIFAG